MANKVWKVVRGSYTQLTAEGNRIRHDIGAVFTEAEEKLVEFMDLLEEAVGMESSDAKSAGTTSASTADTKSSATGATGAAKPAGAVKSTGSAKSGK